MMWEQCALMVSLTTYVSVLTVGYSRSGGEVRFPYSWGLVPDGYAKTQANILDTSLSWSLLPPLLPSRHGGWWFCHACSATAELFVSPFCTALWCSFIRQARERLDWPIYTVLQSLHGILYTTPFRSSVGMGSFGLAKIWRSILFSLNLTWTPSSCKILFTSSERPWT